MINIKYFNKYQRLYQNIFLVKYFLLKSNKLLINLIFFKLKLIPYIKELLNICIEVFLIKIITVIDYM